MRFEIELGKQKCILFLGCSVTLVLSMWNKNEILSRNSDKIQSVNMYQNDFKFFDFFVAEEMMYSITVVSD